MKPEAKAKSNARRDANRKYAKDAFNHLLLLPQREASDVKVFSGDEEALDAFKALSSEEGILPALETSHGLAYGFKRAREMDKDQIICINLSGRGDKDAMEAARLMGVKGLPSMNPS